MLRNIRHLDRGDTIIEVLFAIAVFSLVAITGMVLMNQGTNTVHRAVEIASVRQEIDSQAETLRFLQGAYVAARQAYGSSATYDPATPAGQWNLIRQYVTSGRSISDMATITSCPTSFAQGGFILDTKNARFIPASQQDRFSRAQTYSQIRYNGSNENTFYRAEGIWIEANRSSSASANTYIDFHIRACWDSPGQNLPAMLGTIVRLYEPR
jgi:type II secretory pathway pseudopilin PulG